MFWMMTMALAGDDPQMTAKYRSVMMKGVGAHMGQIGLVMKGKVDRKDDVLPNALAILAAAERFQTLFPEGTDPANVKTEALPAVWSKPEDFKKANTQWLEASKGLVDALRKGDWKAADTARGALGKSCGGCHDQFKKDD